MFSTGGLVFVTERQQFGGGPLTIGEAHHCVQLNYH